MKPPSNKKWQLFHTRCPVAGCNHLYSKKIITESIISRTRPCYFYPRVIWTRVKLRSIKGLQHVRDRCCDGDQAKTITSPQKRTACLIGACLCGTLLDNGSGLADVSGGQMIRTNPPRTIPQEQWERASARVGLCVCVCVYRDGHKDRKKVGAQEKVRGFIST